MTEPNKHKSFSEALFEGVTRNNAPEFTKVMTAAQDGDTHLVMYKLLQTLSNMHDTVADMYKLQGDSGKASYHYQMANRIRTEAQHNKNAAA